VLGHGADDTGGAAEPVGAPVVGGNHVWGSDGAGIVDEPSAGAIGVVGTVTVDDGGAAEGTVMGAGEVTVPGAPPSGTALGK
jgi:hypothetical protein